jgi:Zn-dependent protease/CBS domain-containing protein
VTTTLATAVDGHATMRSSLRLFSIGGIEIGVHVSWLVIFLLVTWSLAVGYFPGVLPEASGLEAWILGAVASLLLFVAVLIHELAHSFVARWQGLEARSITLFIFGGVSNLGGESRTPTTEFLVAIVGPLVSFLLGALAFILSLALEEARAVAIAEYLAFINVALAVFNLLPAFPLDGGRVLRSIVWRVTGSLQRATGIAAMAGRLAAWGFLAYGLLRLMAGDIVGGLWIAVLGWFLHNAASLSEQQTELDLRLRGVTVGDVVPDETIAAPPGLTIDRLIEDYLLAYSCRSVAVVDDRELVGMVSVSDIRDVPATDRHKVQVAEVMSRREDIASVGPDDDLRRALEVLSEGDFEQVPVVDDEGRLHGCLDRADVIRQLELRSALDVQAGRGLTRHGRSTDDRGSRRAGASGPAT